MTDASSSEREGRLVDIGDTALFVVERGGGAPLLVLHGGPGLDHHEFADYLDPLADRYRLLLVDQRSQGRSLKAPVETWTLEQMAADVSSLAAALQLDTYAVLGHSYGAFVALQHAVDSSSPATGGAAATVVSHGVPSAAYLSGVERRLQTFEPATLRAQVAASFEQEATVATADDAVRLLHAQLPFHFADPEDPRIPDFERRIADTVPAPEVMRHFSASAGEPFDLEPRLPAVRRPVLVIGGRHDRVCPVEAAVAIAAGIPGAELAVLEHSGHMSFVEEQERYLAVVRAFLDRTLASTTRGADGR